MTVTFIGHRTVENKAGLRERIVEVAENLLAHGADTFLFGSRGEFNELCYDVIAQLKLRYPHIRRIYVRAEYEYIDDDYERYLLSYYESAYFPQELHGAGRSVYVKRNRLMIDSCDAVVAYCDPNYIPQAKTRSGTAAAVEYAVKKGKRVINLL